MNCIIAWTSRDNSFAALIHSTIKISIKSCSETGEKRENHLAEPLPEARPPSPHCTGPMYGQDVPTGYPFRAAERIAGAVLSRHFSLCHELSFQSVNCIYICLYLLSPHACSRIPSPKSPSQNP